MSGPIYPPASEQEESLPTRLRRVREQCGISRSELAQRAGLSRPTIWAWESGKTQPRQSNLQAMAMALGLSEAELVGDTELALQRSEIDGLIASGWQNGDIPAGLADPQRLKIIIWAAKLSIASLAGIKAQNVKISIDL